MNPIFIDAILTLASIGITAALAIVTPVLRERWDIDIDAGRQATLKSALITGLAGALGRNLTGRAAINAAVNHVIGVGAPDAVKRFGLTRADLENMAQARLQEMQSTPKP